MFFVTYVFSTGCGLEIQQIMRILCFHLTITLNMADGNTGTYWIYFRGKLLECRFHGALFKKKWIPLPTLRKPVSSVSVTKEILPDLADFISD